MVSVYGDIQAKDEYTHPLGAEKHFNESMYFNFFDRGQGRGGFLRIGNRANEGYAEVTLCLYLPGGEVMFNYKRPEITSNDAFDAGGMKSRFWSRWPGTARCTKGRRCSSPSRRR